jgi:hypothetical protein
MSTATKLSLARYRSGRVYLHLAALIRDGHWQWHLAGIARELAR